MPLLDPLSGMFDFVSTGIGNVASLPAVIRDKIILDGIGGSGSTAGYTSGNVSIGTPGLDVMGQARQDLNEQLAYLENLRKMIEDRAIEAGASPEEAQKTAVETVPVNTNYGDYSQPTYGVSSTGGDSGVPAGADIFSVPIKTTIPTPEETFKELEKEQQVARVQQVLANNPNATEEQIKAVIKTYGIPADVLAEATGEDSVKEYIEQRDAAPAGDGFLYPNERLPGTGTNIVDVSTYTNPDGSVVIIETDADGNRYERWGKYGDTEVVDTGADTEVVDTGTELTKEEKSGLINIFLENNPDITLDVLRTKMKNQGVTDQDVIDATGKTPEEIAADTNIGTDTTSGTTISDPSKPKSQTTVFSKPTSNGGVTTISDPSKPKSQTTVFSEPTPNRDGTGTGTGNGNGTGDGNGDGDGTGTGSGISMIGMALSPNRTTSEVLAPDLFKLDNDIPLIGRLTQYTPTAAPQYLLSGISQRYRV